MRLRLLKDNRGERNDKMIMYDAFSIDDGEPGSNQFQDSLLSNNLYGAMVSTRISDRNTSLSAGYDEILYLGEITVLTTHYLSYSQVGPVGMCFPKSIATIKYERNRYEGGGILGRYSKNSSTCICFKSKNPPIFSHVANLIHSSSAARIIFIPSGCTNAYKSQFGFMGSNNANCLLEFDFDRYPWPTSQQLASVYEQATIT